MNNLLAGRTHAVNREFVYIDFDDGVTFGALKVPNSGKKCKNHCENQHLRASRNSEADEADEADPPDDPQNATSGAEPTLGSPRRGSGLR